MKFKLGRGGLVLGAFACAVALSACTAGGAGSSGSNVVSASPGSVDSSGAPAASGSAQPAGAVDGARYSITFPEGWSQVTSNEAEGALTESWNYKVSGDNGSFVTVISSDLESSQIDAFVAGITAEGKDIVEKEVSVPGADTATRYTYNFASGETVVQGVTIVAKNAESAIVATTGYVLDEFAEPGTSVLESITLK